MSPSSAEAKILPSGMERYLVSIIGIPFAVGSAMPHPRSMSPIRTMIPAKRPSFSKCMIILDKTNYAVIITSPTESSRIRAIGELEADS